MPELPEAETIARALAAALAERRIARVRLLRRDFLKTGRPAQLARLAGQRLEAVTRRGKAVVLHVGSWRVVLQLGMAGRVQLARGGAALLPHTHLVLAFADGRELRVANARRIAAGIHLLAEGRAGPLAAMGPDALTIGAEEFVQRMGRRRTPVKSALLNQSILAGVGNIYSDEALFRAGLRPTRRVCAIGRAGLLRLHAAVGEVLTEAIAVGGSTLADANPYRSADGSLGYFTAAHRVYGRYGQPCRACGTTLRRTIVAGRTSTHCPRCQR